MLARSILVFLALTTFAVAGFVITDTDTDTDRRTIDESRTDTGTAERGVRIVPPTSETTVASSTTPAPSTTTTLAVAPTLDPTVEATTSVPRPLEELPRSGSGEFIAAAGEGELVGAGNIIEYSVAAEDGIGIDPNQIAARVEQVLADRRSWIAEGDIGFRRVSTGGTFRLIVASPDTVDQMCRPLRTNGIFSCAQNGFVAINLFRWETATDFWDTGIESYRDYVVNHEVGHYLARPHVGCPADGAWAPVMMQQTKGVGSCRANGWPYPDPLE